VAVSAAITSLIPDEVRRRQHRLREVHAEVGAEAGDDRREIIGGQWLLDRRMSEEERRRVLGGH